MFRKLRTIDVFYAEYFQGIYFQSSQITFRRHLRIHTPGIQRNESQFSFAQA